MKKTKLFTLVAAAGISLVGAVEVVAQHDQLIQAAEHTSANGLLKRYLLPRHLQGTWYDNQVASLPLKIAKYSFTMPGTTAGQKLSAVIYTVGKITGTNKYPWQMVGRNDNAYVHAMRIVKPRRMHGYKWTVIAPVDDRARQMEMAYTMHPEKINGQLVKVLFQADANGQVVQQFFAKPELAKKYGQQKFSDMTYLIK